MIELGGAEFRLPLLIGLFGFLTLQAVIMNKAISLAVVITALRAGRAPASRDRSHLVLIPALAVLLLLSAVKLWRHLARPRHHGRRP
ncbi:MULTISPECIES: hypothetical protein [Cellulomonas]|uniref:hypothetical protein n=1 Tax=Cellulomonas TaxID=1707 RepID=UPI001B354EDC|nr:hypothetical protein [Cellulomonas humilata]